MSLKKKIINFLGGYTIEDLHSNSFKVSSVEKIDYQNLLDKIKLSKREDKEELYLILNKLRSVGGLSIILNIDSNKFLTCSDKDKDYLKKIARESFLFRESILTTKSSV